MVNNTTRRAPKGLFWGLLVVAVGVIILLDQMGIVSASHIFEFFWPAIFIFFGLDGLLFEGGPGRFWGAFLTVAGVLLVLNNFHYIRVRFAVIWPLAIIFWGLWIMVQAFGGGDQRWKSKWVNSWAERVKQSAKFDSTESWFDYAAVFSYTERRITSKNFKGAKIAAVFGGFKIDLTDAEIEGDQAVIHADAVFGGGEIRVPETWIISTPQTAGVFGAYKNETRRQVPEGSAAKRLIITGAAVFGGMVIKN